MSNWVDDCYPTPSKPRLSRVCGKKFFLGVGCGPPNPPRHRGGVGCGVWGFTDFQGVNYLIFREKVPKFSP
ncbi:MAG: hypothetical protein EWV81_17785 [Microcystis aeruginosa Ma_SC_T_19800800_S464]|uniref:Uncharacterized protein n=1 Tax=Microcystis aeruginosa Ma_SC_T_19800800_S464 TaxID=2486257 RepID=A0A552DK85_MICAE|nr:MAG: hypothetical protein EWV81_17785 [Microcystis aeruginosa Ma_SC_T_19800800_S464]